MVEFDPGPPAVVADHFASVPDYSPFKEFLWFSWGPIFYRGRLDRSARVLCVASDPGPTERIAHRTLVGDAGQRVQGFLSKIRLTRSYVCLNALAYALFPSQSSRAGTILRDPDQRRWRNELFSLVSGDGLQAVVAFGVHAQTAIRLWDTIPDVPLFNVPHPSSRDPKRLLDSWREAVTELREIVTPDDGCGPLPANYGDSFAEEDYAPIPRYDLPFGVPDWFGDDSWGRASTPRRNNSVRRPIPDDRHTLIWVSPRGTNNGE